MGINWFLNRWLTTWREGVNTTYGNRSKHSDGTIGNYAHSVTVSEHNMDPDGSVDAWDMDVNLFNSSMPTGSAAELQAIEDLKRAFEKDPGSQLWIHNRQIANRDIDNWRRRPYYGANDHKQHVHWQSRKSRERLPIKGVTLDDIADAINEPEPKPVTGGTMGKGVIKGIARAPKWPHPVSHSFRASKHPSFSATVKAWQRQMKMRGWNIDVDGYYGHQSAGIAVKFQREKKLTVDGLLGPNTFQAAWLAPITK